jgi:hypothetical protein
VYQTYEFFLKRPPSVLGALLGSEESPNDTVLIPSTIQSFSYVAIFPLSSHFNTLVANLPRLDRLFVQLVPRNEILEDREEMRNIQIGDLWMERNTSYSLIMRELFESSSVVDLLSIDSDDEDGSGSDAGDGQRRESNWRHLREFESGDAADKEAWDMAVQYVRMSGAPWEVEREGVFVKRQPKDDDTPEDDSPSASNNLNFWVSSSSNDQDGGGDDGPSGFELLSVQPPHQP